MPANSWAAHTRLATPPALDEPEGLRPATIMMDEPSFQAFFRQAAGPLRAYVVRVTGNAATADDIVQEAFLRLLRSPPPTREPHELRAFLFRIASNLMNDHWRQRRREPVAGDARAPEPSVAPRDIPLRVDMARTFEQLRPRQRQLLWLAYVEGAGHREIADALGLRPRSVRVLLYRARHKLAQLLGPRPPDRGER